MRFSKRATSKSVSASTTVETSVASPRSKITKKHHNRSPAGDEKTSEEWLPTFPSPRIKPTTKRKPTIKRQFNKKSGTWSVKAATGAKMSPTSTESKIAEKPHKKLPAGGEETSDKVTIRSSDVLLGRGNGIAKWVGNMTFRAIVCSYKTDYQKAYRHEKSLVSVRVIEDVHEGGGRFVEKSPSGGHVVVSFEKALEKTCQCLREKPNSDSVNVIVLPQKCSEIVPAKRKGMCSPSRPSKKAKKARTEEATKVLPSASPSMVTKKNSPKKEPRVPKISLKNKPTKKEPQVPRKVVKKSTSSNVAAGAAKVCPMSSGITTVAKRTESEDGCRVQKLVDKAVEIKMQSYSSDLDEMFVLVPPNLTSFFSGIVSLSESSIHAVIGKGHPGADVLTRTPTSTPSRGKSLAVLKQARDKQATVTKKPESPTNVADFDRVMLEAIFEPAFEPTQSNDFVMDIFEDSSAHHWSSHGYME